MKLQNPERSDKRKEGKKMRKKKLLAGILSLAMVIGMVPTAQVSAAKKISLSGTKLTVEKGKTKTLKVKGTTKKVTWKALSGKKYITPKAKNM